MPSNFGVFLSSIPRIALGSTKVQKAGGDDMPFQVEQAAKQALAFLHANHAPASFEEIRQRLELQPEQLVKVLEFLDTYKFIAVDGQGTAAKISLTEYATDALQVFKVA